MNQNMPEMVAVWELLEEKSSSYFYWMPIESVIINFYQDVGYTFFFSKLVNMFKTKCTLFVCQLHSRLILM